MSETIRLCSKTFHSTCCFARLLCRFAHIERPGYCTSMAMGFTNGVGKPMTVVNSIDDRQECSVAKRLAVMTNTPLQGIRDLSASPVLILRRQDFAEGGCFDVIASRRTLEPCCSDEDSKP